MSSIRGKRKGHSHNNALAKAKELDASPENFDSTLESPLNRANNQAKKAEIRAAEFRLEQRQIAEAKLGEPKILMRDGKWLVPPEERPVGWERLIPDGQYWEIAQNSADSICTPLPEQYEEKS